jgi:hypothetical protein
MCFITLCGIESIVVFRSAQPNSDALSGPAPMRMMRGAQDVLRPAA